MTVFLVLIKLHSNHSRSRVAGTNCCGAIALVYVVAWCLLPTALVAGNTLGSLAIMIICSAFAAPALLGSDVFGEDPFILVGFRLLGLSYGQAAAVIQLKPKFRIPAH
jgi:hypothetical protein